jgi:hypothetical protein
MAGLRMTRFMIAVATGALSLADAAAARDTGTHRLTLPTEWKTGSQQRYRVSWERKVGKWSAPGPPPRAFDTAHSGEVTVTVSARSKSEYVLRWEPVLAPVSAPPTDGDVDAAGLWAWQRELALPLEIGFDPRSTDRRLTLRNEATVRAALAGDMRAVMRGVIGSDAMARVETECQAVPGAAGCATLQRAPGG